MSIDLNREKLKALANELAKDIKTEKDLNALSAELLKMTVEAALGAESSISYGQSGFQEMDHADSKLEVSAQSV